MTFSVTIGRYGGFYIHFGRMNRLCLGFVAFDLLLFEYDEAMANLLYEKSDKHD